MEIANSNDFTEIGMDWEYIQTNVVPQISQKIDIGAIKINIGEIIGEIIIKLLHL